MLTLLAFLLGILILVVVHELGHYLVARWCGVMVTRFSIGFGSPIWRWQRDPMSTEFVVARWPLGGYVRMLDEAVDDVPLAMRPLAFNRQSVARRLAIVCAGPVANVLLAVFLYASVQWLGAQRAVPILATPSHHSLAAAAGLSVGDRVLAARTSDRTEPVLVNSWDDLWWQVTQALTDQRRLYLVVRRNAHGVETEVELNLTQLVERELSPSVVEQIGLHAVRWDPVVKSVAPGGPAERAGVMAGDFVLAINDEPVQDVQALRIQIQAAVDGNGRGVEQRWLIQRDGQSVTLDVTPEGVQTESGRQARAGVYLDGSAPTAWMQAGFWDGWAAGAQKTVDVAALSLKAFAKMVVGEASVSQLSGPVGVAKVAGQSAAMGLSAYLQFLAFFSVSLAVINALPIPLLDGGHVMYYLWEWATGRPPSDRWLHLGQRLGMVIIAALMALALSNDLARLLG